MDKKTNKDILGRFVVAAFVAYFIFRYNYEVTQFLHSCGDFLSSFRNSISTYLERTSDDSGIFLKLILIIVYIIWAIIQIILLIVGGLILWILVTLNKIYVLPFLIPLLIVYSKFSYSFVVTPLLWLPQKTFLFLGKFGRLLLKLGNLFIIVPMLELIALKDKQHRRPYKILISLLFVFGLCGIVIGGTGIAIKIIQDGKYVPKIESMLEERITDVFKNPTYVEFRHKATIQATTPNWTQTSIQLRKNDIVLFKATGLIRCISPLKAGMSTTDPKGLYLFNGYVTPSRLTKSYREKGFSQSSYILPDENINCLMAKVETEQPFAVGYSKTYKVKSSGVLYLGINQLWKEGAWKNNQGYFSIDIVIRRKV